MSPAPDTTTAGNGDTFDPQQAAAVLGQATQQARRRLEPSPPWLLAIRAVMVLAVSIAVWATVHGQHPYNGPTAAVLPWVAAFVVINFAATVAVGRRATTGVSGKSRLRPGEIAVMAGAWISVFVVLGVLAGAGVRHSIVYGVYPTTVPLIVAGLAWAGIMASRGNRRACGGALAIAVVGAAGLLAGPAGSWLVAGGGICAVLLGSAVAIAWRQHRGLVRP
jgi:hypothetical protein